MIVESIAPEPPVIEGDGSQTSVTIAVIENPAITAQVFELHGQVRYDHVADVGYIELLTAYPDGSEYFSRTLAPHGDMGHLTGSSPWRAFRLPFQQSADMSSPSRLTLNIFLPAQGRVEIKDLQLIEHPAVVAIEHDAQAPTHAWWSSRTAGLIGGLGGAMLGILGGIVGIVGGSKRRYRLALQLLNVMWIVSAVALAAGLIGVFAGQPYAVYYPLLLLGLVGTIIPLGVSRCVRQRMQQDELRKMQSLDAT